MNCPHCGMPEEFYPDDPTPESPCHDFSCGSWTGKYSGGHTSPACIEIVVQKSRADKAEEMVRVLEDRLRRSEGSEKYWFGQVDGYRERVRVLEEKNKRLVHYAQHKPNCLQNAYGIDLRCTCGFLNALTGGKEVQNASSNP